MNGLEHFLTRLFGIIVLPQLLAFGTVYADTLPPVQVGWIGAMSGSIAKYGAHEAAMLAAEDVNAAGGIRGRNFELDFQDGKGSSKDALNAIEVLIHVKHLKYIVGGHSSTESLPIAAVAERSKVLMMAAITSSPKLSNAGDYVFRVTARNTDGAKLLLEYAQAHAYKRIGIVYEETEYAQGLAEFFEQEAAKYGITIVSSAGFLPNETDMKTVVTRLKGIVPDALYFSPQSPDGSITFLRSIREQGIDIPILGNEIAGNTVKAAGQQQQLFEGMLFAEPEFDSESPAVKNFEKRYMERFNVAALPYGFYTCEAYDAVHVIADTIASCGDDVEAVKKCLYELKGYKGLSGPITFDKNGDGIRHYILKKVVQGEIKPWASSPTDKNSAETTKQSS